MVCNELCATMPTNPESFPFITAWSFLAISINFINGQRAFDCKVPMDVGFVCGVQPTSLYYFDVQDDKCKLFQYLGCGGSGNRWSSLSECMETCGVFGKCPAGQPLTDPIGNIQNCVLRTISCPVGYECLGVDNFSTSEKPICCPSKDHVCQQPVDEGSRCLGVTTRLRHFYDPLAKTCRIFTYYGCGGNQNSFGSKEECMEFCADEVLCERGDPLPQAFSPYLRECDAMNPCPHGHDCIQRGLKVKGIRYTSVCCPNREYICRQPQDHGSACSLSASDLRWYYDRRSGQCDSLKFAGCEGNLNNFYTMAECQAFCMGKCPEGTEPFVAPITGQPLVCQSEVGTDLCPAGHKCTKTNAGSNLCCKTSPMCPGYSEMYLHPTTQTPVYCRLDNGVALRCPGDFVCTEANNKEYVCCSRPLDCPSGFSPFRDGPLSEPRQCSPGVPGACPDKYRCTRASMDKYLCCRPHQVCVMPYVDPLTFFAKTCIPGITECPGSTKCLLNQIDQEFYCCFDVTYSRCEDGSLPFMNENDKRMKNCSQGDLRTCPANFDCRRLSNGETGCCRVPLVDELCRVAYVDSDLNAVVPCDRKKLDCPFGTQCMQASDRNFYCCRH